MHCAQLNIIFCLYHPTIGWTAGSRNPSGSRNFTGPIQAALDFINQAPAAELLPSSNLEAKLKQKVLNFLSDESGATAIEYGLIAAGISLAIIAIVNTLGTTLNTKFTDINTSLK
jgi:pilus assembly protein Flp/PilA